MVFFFPDNGLVAVVGSQSRALDWVLFLLFRLSFSKALALTQKIRKRLENGALEVVLDWFPGFHRHLFLAQKTARDWRPVTAVTEKLHSVNKLLL